jgi:hypothetical protein
MGHRSSLVGLPKKHVVPRVSASALGREGEERGCSSDDISLQVNRDGDWLRSSFYHPQSF